MFRASEKSTGTGYTTTVAFLLVAFVFSPAVLIISRPLGLVSVSLAIACSALCITLAWMNWKRSSQLSIPSIAVSNGETK
jgi:VIT1/CCC1 family predicted Fe2+/Mn2+ transporter